MPPYPDHRACRIPAATPRSQQLDERFEDYVSSAVTVRCLELVAHVAGSQSGRVILIDDPIENRLLGTVTRW